MNGEKREAMLFTIAIAILLTAIFAFFTIYILREQTYRKLAAEYSAYQFMSTMFEDYESESGQLVLNDQIQGFGVYLRDGQPLWTGGTAPKRYPQAYLGTNAPVIAYESASIKIFRPLGVSIGMPGIQFGRGQGRDQRISPMPGADRSPADMMSMLTRRYVFVEYATPELFRQRISDFVMIAVALAALSGLFVLTVRLYRRNRAYRQKEAQTRELVELGQAARTLAHELKNPLGVISVQCATLRKTVPEDRRRGVDMIYEEVSRMSALTDKVGEYLRNSKGSPAVIEIVPYLQDFAERYGEGVILRQTGKEVSVFVDPDRLRSVVQNLVQNAFESYGELPDAEPAGPDARSVEIESEGSQNLVIISVLDRGCGVSPESSLRIFTPFFTTKAKGSGIGLAMSRQFARNVGGDIRYKPRPGGGSVFSVSLPVYKGTKDANTDRR